MAMVLRTGSRAALVVASAVLLAGLMPGVAQAEPQRGPDRSNGGFQEAPKVVGVAWGGPLVVGWLNYDRAQNYRVQVTGAGGYSFSREIWIPEGTSIRRRVPLDPVVSTVGHYRAVFLDADGNEVFDHRFRAVEPVKLTAGRPPRAFLPLVRDGIRDAVGVPYTIDRPARMYGQIIDRRGRVRQVVNLGRKPAGDHRWSWSGFDRNGVVERGRYTLRLTARADALSTTRLRSTRVASYRVPVTRTVRRLGNQTDTRSPGDCRISGAPRSSLYVDCQTSDRGAEVRYRFAPGPGATGITAEVSGIGAAPTPAEDARTSRVHNGAVQVTVPVDAGEAFTVRAVRVSYTVRKQL